MNKYLLVVFIVLFKVCYAASIVVGVQAPLTGQYADQGLGMKNIIELLIERVNAHGGINGDKMELVVCDDQDNPTKALACAQSLIKQGVKIVIGSYSVATTTATQALYAKNGIIQTSNVNTQQLLQRNYSTYFEASSSDTIEGEYTAKYLAHNYKRIAIVTDNSTLGNELAGIVANKIKQLGGNVVYQTKITHIFTNIKKVLNKIHILNSSVASAHATDFKSMLTKLQAKQPDVIYYAGYYPDGGMLRAQQVAMQINIAFVGNSMTFAEDFIKIAGESAAIGSDIVYTPYTGNDDNRLAKMLVNRYQRMYHIPIPSLAVIQNADGFLAILDVMKATKSNDIKTITPHIRHALQQIPSFTGKLTLDAHGARIDRLYQVDQLQTDLTYKMLDKEKATANATSQ